MEGCFLQVIKIVIHDQSLLRKWQSALKGIKGYTPANLMEVYQIGGKNQQKSKVGEEGIFLGKIATTNRVAALILVSHVPSFQ